MAPQHPRLDKNNVALLIIDHQVGLFQLVRDFEPATFKNAVLAYAALGNTFSLPTVLTTSAETGPNGPMWKEILDMHPDAPIVKRNGEVNAWDNPDFREEVEKTGKKQLIIAGITTDVCTAFLALSLIEAGYAVFACSDASGTFDERTGREAHERMRAHGVQVMSGFAIACDLMRDWRNTPGAPELLPYFDRYLPTYSFVARGHLAAIKNGQLLPGEEHAANGK